MLDSRALDFCHYFHLVFVVSVFFLFTSILHNEKWNAVRFYDSQTCTFPHASKSIRFLVCTFPTHSLTHTHKHPSQLRFNAPFWSIPFEACLHFCCATNINYVQQYDFHSRGSFCNCVSLFI